jgi:transcriptional regulator of acetoin/glycerol metabolism
MPGREIAIAADLWPALAAYRWPGNLRQLANALRTACALLEPHEAVVGWPHLCDELAHALRGAPAAAEEELDLRGVSRAAITRAVDECAGNLSEAARRLGISRNTLYRKLRH